jgi:hypothetical protein
VKQWAADDAANIAAEAEAAQAARSTPDLIRQTMAGSSTPIPLNGPGVIRAALSGMGVSGAKAE